MVREQAQGVRPAHRLLREMEIHPRSRSPDGEGSGMTILDALLEWWRDFARRIEDADLQELNRVRCHYARKLMKVEREIAKRTKPNGVMSR